ncbi:hypothetical protein QQ045_025450 [Rhodiola kirilowii]
MLSFSVPNTTTSSPSQKSNKGKSNWNRTRPPSGTTCILPDTDSTQSKGGCSFQLARSKSCGEGRASTPSVDDSHLPHVTTRASSNTTPKRLSSNQGFTCGGALCVFFPSFSKAKADKTPVINEVEAASGAAGVGPAADITAQEIDNFLSKRVSMAKFEWGSRSSSAAIICKDDKENESELTQSPDYYTEQEDQEDDALNLYFDLPLELMRCTADDSPEKAAFIFNSYQGHTKTFSHNNSSDPLISSSAKDSV